MKMLKSLTLENFCSHELSKFEFSPGITVITGTSSAGKSHIRRSLDLVAKNRPLGDGMIRRGTKDFCVTLELLQDDFPLIKRGRNKSGNFYKITCGEDNQPFDAFGSTVPLEVTELLNIKDINIQNQHDPYFLVFDSPGQVALCINKVTKINEIDEVVSNISSRIRSEVGIKKDLTENLKLTVSGINAIEQIDLNSFATKLSDAKAKEIHVTELQKKIKNLNLMLANFKGLEKEKVVVPEWVTDSIQNGMVISANIKAKSESIVRLKSIISSLSNLTNIVISDDDKNLLQRSVEAQKSHLDTKELYVKIQNILTKLSSVNKQLKDTSNTLDGDREDKSELLKQITVCPTCLQKVEGEVKENMLEKLC